MTDIPFAEWTPDRPELVGSNIAENVVPRAGGYGPFKSPASVSDALDNRAQGFAAIKSIQGFTTIFAGDAGKLYKLLGGVWEDVSGSAYATPVFGRWEFEEFGQLALAVNGANKLQRYNLGGTDNFVEVVDSPIGKHIAVVKDFVVIGGDNIYWSARNNADGWTPTVDSSGVQSLVEGGPLNGITGGDFGTILQESSVTRMTFVGGDVVFQFDTIEQARGCIAPGSIGKLGLFTYYWSNYGVEVFDGVQGQNIGEGKVNRFLLDNLDFGNLDKVSVAIDPKRRLVVWGYPSNDSDGTPDRLLIYYVGENRFSEARIDHQLLATPITPTISIDDIAGSIDDVPLTGFPGVTSLDDPRLFGGLLRFGMFDATNQLNYFTGNNLAAKASTAEFAPNRELRSEIQRLRPLNDDSDTTITVRHRETQQATVIEDTPLDMRPDGSVPCRVNDRYFSFQSNLVSADWTEAQGVNLEEVVSRGR